ncbi:MAG: 16S rRNA (cytosine(1402)-N(4))-methyltransferase RsmH [Victivallales bacterium]|nr:16S rRNA (cytosine(1402)-N(4))-methyltransferase RsmH [Victivallales bacterium]
MTESQHISVLAKEVLEAFADMDEPRIIDGTLGLGGHSAMLLESIPGAQILGIDRDDVALRQAGQRLEPYGDRVLLFRGAFSDMADFAAEAGWDTVDGILLDVGVSSPQIDTAARGFSHRFDGPLDMRMDRRRQETAATILNNESVEELADIFFHYGEERNARRVARAIVKRREEKPWSRTGEFAELLENVIGRPKHGPPPATRCFQALRIAVNDELGELDRALVAAVPLLATGGRLAVISFHSLEDRIVKLFFRHEASACTCPPDIPVCVCDKVATLRVVTRKPITASPEECEANRRASSAKLRVAEKLPTPEETGTTNRRVNTTR